MIARKAVQVISTEDKIEATAAKEIVLTAGGSQVKITGSGIFMTTSGKFEVKAGQHLFKGGAEVGMNLQGLPAYEAYNERFKMLLPSGGPLSFVDYKISSEGKEIFANSDKKGQTKEIHSPKEQGLKLDLLWLDLETVDEAEVWVDPAQGSKNV